MITRVTPLIAPRFGKLTPAQRSEFEAQCKAINASDDPARVCDKLELLAMDVDMLLASLVHTAQREPSVQHDHKQEDLEWALIRQLDTMPVLDPILEAKSLALKDNTTIAATLKESWYTKRVLAVMELFAKIDGYVPSAKLWKTLTHVLELCQQANVELHGATADQDEDSDA